MVSKWIVSVAALFCAATFIGQAQQMEPWHEGYLDIHSLSTGRGDCTFVIMPDGTSMLIDAGDVGTGWHVAQPNASKKPSEWIAKYIHDFSAGLPHRDTVDYFYLTHYHGDHFGVQSIATPGKHGYRLGGITNVGEYIHFNKIIDRDCPNYNIPSEKYFTTKTEAFLKDYIAYCKYQHDSCGTALEKFQIGSRKQFRMLYNPRPYKKAFEVYNIAANASIHTGKGLKTRKMYDEDPEIFDENMFSSVILMKYGKFSYYNGGDIGSGPHESFKAQHRDWETPVADLIGGHVTVIKPDHHGWIESSNGYFLKKLCPEVIVEMCSNRTHPYAGTLARMVDPMTYNSPKSFYITTDGCRERLDGIDSSLWKNFVPYYGHIVIRVYEGGSAYQVFVLDSKIPDYHILFKSEVVTTVSTPTFK